MIFPKTTNKANNPIAATETIFAKRNKKEVENISINCFRKTLFDFILFSMWMIMYFQNKIEFSTIKLSVCQVPFQPFL